MNLQHRIGLLTELGEYLRSDDPGLLQAKEKASQENGWFIPEFVDLAIHNISKDFLQKDILKGWTEPYNSKIKNPRLNDSVGQEKSKTVGITMAGNIPLAGFHDLLSVFISGHKAMIKPSSKDQALIKHIADKMTDIDNEVSERIGFGEMLKGCDAYIATGSNNSSRYFEYYFGKYPHIIRRNRTSVAILNGDEKAGELEKLADDVYQYFGLGCRNVTKIYIPPSYDFIPLLTAFRKYSYLADHFKYKNNYDYNLAILLLNKKYYMSNDSILLVEDPALFSPISQLHYEFYVDKKSVVDKLLEREDLQCIISKDFIPFGQGQTPGIADYADGADTLEFLSRL